MGVLLCEDGRDKEISICPSQKGCTKQNRVSQHSSMKLPQVPAVCPMSRDLFSHLQPLLWVQEVPLHLSFPWFQQALELQGCLEDPWRRKRNTVCCKRGQGAHTHRGCTHPPFLSCVKQSPSSRSVYEHPGSASTHLACPYGTAMIRGSSLGAE